MVAIAFSSIDKDIVKEKGEAIADQERSIAQQERTAKEQAEAIAISERQRADRLATYLRSLGINPDDI